MPDTRHSRGGVHQTDPLAKLTLSKAIVYFNAGSIREATANVEHGAGKL